MAQFCTCGSLMINDSCTNKNCINKVSAKSGTTKKRVGGEKKVLEATEKKAKPTRTKRASKCVTYNLYDKKEEESSI
ncbi:UNVERIFIED_CONTAM: hypothetical protein Cloal_3315 [Acetivibrio alkalicellulosi]